MISISQAVESIIKVKPFLTEGLNDGLINISALARLILPEVKQLTHKDVKHGAIVMALNRLPTKQITNISKEIDNLRSMLGDIIVRSDLTDYTFRNSDTLAKCHLKVFESITHHTDIFYTMVRGVNESNLVISSLYVQLVDKHFKKEELYKKKENLSAITIKLHENNTMIPGFYYYILKSVAWEGINIFEVISTTNEFTILVDDNDVDRAFSELKKIKRIKNH